MCDIIASFRRILSLQIYYLKIDGRYIICTCNEAKDGQEDIRLVEWSEKHPVKSPNISDREIAGHSGRSRARGELEKNANEAVEILNARVQEFKLTEFVECRSNKT